MHPGHCNQVTNLCKLARNDNVAQMLRNAYILIDIFKILKYTIHSFILIHKHWNKVRLLLNKHHNHSETSVLSTTKTINSNLQTTTFENLRRGWISLLPRACLSTYTPKKKKKKNVEKHISQWKLYQSKGVRHMKDLIQ